MDFLKLKRTQIGVPVFLIIIVISIRCTIPKENPPNIIILLADDAGYADFGFNGSKDLKTPNIDKLATQGTVFTDFHVSAGVCGPSRAGLITGRYQHRFGAEYNENPVPLSEVMLSEILKNNGYKTAAFGKWHLGYEEEHHPNTRGFDEFYGFIGGHRNYFPDQEVKKDGKSMQLNGKYVNFEGYLTDDLGDKASDFIKKNKENPFFIYLAYNAVHTPMQATKEDMALFKGHSRQKLAAMTWSLDRSVGHVMQTLKEEGLDDNTIVVFFSDNGGPTSNTSSNAPFKGTKGTEFEGGHRVPFIIKWNDKIKANATYSRLTSSLDLYPTFLKAAGIKEQPKNKLDGVAWQPYLDGEVKGAPHKQLFWRINPWSAVREDSLKVVRAGKFGEGFYNLNTDIGEVDNIIEDNKATFERLVQDYEAWQIEFPEPTGIGRSPKWEEVKGYMYDDMFNNRPIRIHSPGQLKAFKKKLKKEQENIK